MKNTDTDTIYFDLDGTLYDLYSQPNWLARITTEADASVYATDALIPNGVEFANCLARLCRAGYRIGVVSWLAGGASVDFNRAVRKIKREWVKKNLPQATEIHIVKYGTPKHRIVQDRTAILVDDNAEILATWKGLTIDANQNIIPILEGLVK
jgi:5'(3')-deoxyribonucleotidase